MGRYHGWRAAVRQASIDVQDRLETRSCGFRMTPLHFYGELVRTEEGRHYLRESGHMERFVKELQEFDPKDEDPVHLLRIKAVLWTLVWRDSLDVWVDVE